VPGPTSSAGVYYEHGELFVLAGAPGVYKCDFDGKAPGVSLSSSLLQVSETLTTLPLGIVLDSQPYAGASPCSGFLLFCFVVVVVAESRLTTIPENLIIHADHN
jgi:hypothetical protein